MSANDNQHDDEDSRFDPKELERRAEELIREGRMPPMEDFLKAVAEVQDEMGLYDESRNLSESELRAIDADEPGSRPVLFNFLTGKRIKTNESTSLDEYDIQSDDQYCPWCGTSNADHYSPWSQWLPCKMVTAVRVAVAQARKHKGQK